MAVDEQRMRFTIERYDRMVEAGIFTEDDHVELVDGEIFELTPIYPPHASVLGRLTRLFYASISDRAIIRVQDPVRLPPHSAPQPDLAIASLRADGYAHHHPAPSELHLVAEVVDTTHGHDRRKFAAYARGGVRESWFIDIPAHRIEVHRGPSPDGYTSVEISGRGEDVSAEAFPDAIFAVADILG